jgi:hypothetical protein
MTRHWQKARIFSILLTFSALSVAAATLTSVPSAKAASDPDSLAPQVSSVYCGNNTWALSVTPARGFSPLTATAAQLKANGFPDAPATTDGRAYSQWRAYAARYHGEKGTCPPAAKSGQWPAISMAEKSTDWAGYQVTGQVYSDVEASWSVPWALETAGTNTYSASWVGIGQGTSRSDPLVQAGTVSDYDDTTVTGQYALWYEVFPEAAPVPLDGVSPGDSVGAHITWYLGQIAGCTAPACATIHVWDYSQSPDFNSTYIVGGSWINDQHAEWIFERPCALDSTTGKCWFHFLDDAPPKFAAAQVGYGGKWYPAGSTNTSVVNRTEIDMYNCALTTKLAWPTGLATNGSQFGFGVSGSVGDSHACYVVG